MLFLYLIACISVCCTLHPSQISEKKNQNIIWPQNKTVKSEMNDSMWLAIRKGYIPILTSLFSYETIPDINSTYFSFTPLQYALRTENLELLKTLISLGADVNFAPKGTRTPLRMALDQGSIGAAQFFLQNGAILQNRDLNESLMNAIQWRSPQVVNFLIQLGADVNTKARDDITPLIRSARSDSPKSEEIIELLITHGANVNAQDIHGRTAAHHAAVKGYPKKIVLLAKYGMDLNAYDLYGIAPIMLAAANDDAETVRALVAAGASADILNYIDNKSVLDYANNKSLIEDAIEEGLKLHDLQTVDTSTIT